MESTDVLRKLRGHDVAGDINVTHPEDGSYAAIPDAELL